MPDLMALHAERRDLCAEITHLQARLARLLDQITRLEDK